ncbi:MAG: hypothetical protein K6G62_07440 [Eubacterium sp.]|nr:hypothetical protein [Eubacterium sp.]
MKKTFLYIMGLGLLLTGCGVSEKTESAIENIQPSYVEDRETIKRALVKSEEVLAKESIYEEKIQAYCRVRQNFSDQKKMTVKYTEIKENTLVEGEVYREDSLGFASEEDYRSFLLALEKEGFAGVSQVLENHNSKKCLGLLFTNWGGDTDNQYELNVVHEETAMGESFVDKYLQTDINGIYIKEEQITGGYYEKACLRKDDSKEPGAYSSALEVVNQGDKIVDLSLMFTTMNMDALGGPILSQSEIDVLLPIFTDFTGDKEASQAFLQGLNFTEDSGVLAGRQWKLKKGSDEYVTEKYYCITFS